MKICSKCNEEKELGCYNKDNARRDKLKSYCKECDRVYQQTLRAGKEEYYKEYNRVYREKNIDKLLDYWKNYHAENLDHIRFKNKKYREENPEQTKLYYKKYYQENKELIKDKTGNYKKRRRKVDPLFVLTERIRDSIRRALKKNGYPKRSKAPAILGCTFEEFYEHIEKQFLPNMNWDNRSEWHLDHVVPISFGESEEEIILLNHYSNFRPLWGKDNLAKSDTLTEESIGHPIYKVILENRKK